MLTADEVVRLIAEVDHHRYAAVVAIMFTVGLRVSEVLGLAWCDIDLDAGTAHVRRAVVAGEDGRRFGPTKTEGATGVHHLAEGTVERCAPGRAQQAEERLLAGPLWRTHTYESQPLDPVFTKPDGGLVARQQIDKLLRRAAEKVGIDATRLGTHVGRRTVVTALYTAGTDIGDIARHVGHASPATTSRYVASLGERPLKTARLAAQLLDTPMSRSTEQCGDQPHERLTLIDPKRSAGTHQSARCRLMEDFVPRRRIVPPRISPCRRLRSRSVRGSTPERGAGASLNCCLARNRTALDRPVDLCPVRRGWLRRADAREAAVRSSWWRAEISLRGTGRCRRRSIRPFESVMTWRMGQATLNSWIIPMV